MRGTVLGKSNAAQHRTNISGAFRDENYSVISMVIEINLLIKTVKYKDLFLNVKHCIMQGGLYPL